MNKDRETKKDRSNKKCEKFPATACRKTVQQDKQEEDKGRQIRITKWEQWMLQ